MDAIERPETRSRQAFRHAADAGLAYVVPEHPQADPDARLRAAIAIQREHTARVERVAQTSKYVLAQLRRERAARRAGIDRDALRALKEKSHRFFLYDSDPEAPDEEETPDAAQRIVRAESSPDGWAIHSAPFPGWDRSWAWKTVNTFDLPRFTCRVEAATGRLVNETNLRNNGYNPTDGDYGRLELNTGFGFWYQTTRDARIDVRVQMAAPTDWGIEHWLRHSDAAASSSADSAQSACLYLAVNGSMNCDRISRISADEDDGQWARSHYADYQGPHFFDLRSNETWPAGAWVYLRIGHRNYCRSKANGVGVDSTLNAHWTVQSVWVR
jgi:hypothetical protein